jgi:lipopolysaccharide biosynthesis glycosyltransferase
MKLFVGYDPKEAAAYHVFTQSVIEKASIPVSFHPLAPNMLGAFDGKRDGSNAFTFSRFLVPHLTDYNGWAAYFDGDMVCDVDIANLKDYSAQHFDKAVAVVKHDYHTKHPRKYIGSSMESPNSDYPSKNNSSVILWNCSHYANRALKPNYIASQAPSFLHRFEWLEDKQIGEIPPDWNHLVGEYPPASPSLYHYTLGIPGIKYYANDHGSWKWHAALLRGLHCAGEDPKAVVERAQAQVGEP